MPTYDDVLFNPPAPVVTCELRHPDERQRSAPVLMLLDTGAEITLLPQSLAATLALPDTGTQCPLEAFDGTLSHTPVVRAHLVLLQRNFQGMFPLLKGDVGVIGRDLLKHLCLRFDGPTQQWEDCRPITTG